MEETRTCQAEAESWGKLFNFHYGNFLHNIKNMVTNSMEQIPS
jgi:hypothetical protein